jgi:GNAT superfamily N-acetyltransferase
MTATRPVTIRPAVVAEHALLEALQRRASLANAGDRDALLACPEAVGLPVEQIASGGVFVASVGGRVTGFSAILARDDGGCELDALFVEPDAWRQGIGRALVAQCADAARAHGATALHVVGNPHAEGFYRSCGLDLLGTKPMQFGIGLLMKLDLG